MITVKKIVSEQCCRSCLNEKYGMNLKRSDVIIYSYQHPCHSCKRMSNIVYSVRKSRRWKLLFAKKRHE